jgi:hypothetical protein
MVEQLISGTAVDSSFVPARVPGVVAVDADGEAVLVDEVADLLHLLNTSARVLWECFDGESSIGDVAFDVADVMGAPFEQVLADSIAIVAELVAQGVCYDARSAPPDRPVDMTNDPLRDRPNDIPRRPPLLEEPPGG